MPNSMSAWYIAASASDRRLWQIGIERQENPAQSGCASIARMQSSITSGSGRQCDSVKNR